MAASSVAAAPHDPGGHLLIFVEFQSGRDPDMALRIATYAATPRELETVGQVWPGGSRPPILPLLIHNGPGRWTASTALDRPIANPGAAGDRRDPPGGRGGSRLAARDLAAFQLSYAEALRPNTRRCADRRRCDSAGRHGGWIRSSIGWIPRPSCRRSASG